MVPRAKPLVSLPWISRSRSSVVSRAGTRCPHQAPSALIVQAKSTGRLTPWIRRRVLYSARSCVGQALRALRQDGAAQELLPLLLEPALERLDGVVPGDAAGGLADQRADRLA